MAAPPPPEADEEACVNISPADVASSIEDDVAAAIASLADGLRGSSRSRAEKEALEEVARKIGVNVYCEHRLKVIACIMGPNAAADAAKSDKEKAEAKRLRKNLYMKVRRRRLRTQQA
jgi:hypothetical protein